MATPQRRKARKLIILGLIVIGLAGLGTWAVLRKRVPPIVVQTQKVARRNLTELVLATGRIQPVTKVVINPEVSGEIVDLPVREGQVVKKGDLLVRIRPDPYIASRNSSEATYRSSLANVELAQAEREKARLEFERFKKLHDDQLISDSEFLTAQTSLEVAQARLKTSQHQVEQAKAALARADEDLAKTTIMAPIDGTVTSLKSERGERVVGTAMMAGTEVMTVADLDTMEARVDVGEIDVVLVKVGQTARLEVDAFRDRLFTGEVTEIANAARTQGMGTQSEATKFEVRIRVREKEFFRPGMSVTTEIETRYRTNVLTVPIQSVTTRLPKDDKGKGKDKDKDQDKQEAADGTKASPEEPRDAAATESSASEDGTAAGAESGADTTAAATGETGQATNAVSRFEKRRAGTGPKPIEVVFVVESGKAVMKAVQRGISDEEYTEITSGLNEDEEVVSGGYKAINRELEDGKLVRVDNTVKPVTRRGADEEEK